MRPEGCFAVVNDLKLKRCTARHVQSLKKKKIDEKIRRIDSAQWVAFVVQGCPQIIHARGKMRGRESQKKCTRCNILYVINARCNNLYK